MLNIEIAYNELSKWGDSLVNKDSWRYEENKDKRKYFYNLIINSLEKDKKQLSDLSSYLFQEINNINFKNLREWEVLNDTSIISEIKYLITYNKELDLFKRLNLDTIFKDVYYFKDFICEYKREIIENKCRNNVEWFKNNLNRFYYKDNIYIDLIGR